MPVSAKQHEVFWAALLGGCHVDCRLQRTRGRSRSRSPSVFPQDFLYEDMESLTEMLRALATDGNKHRAKVDKRKQRSVFRDVLRAVEVSRALAEFRPGGRWVTEPHL